MPTKYKILKAKKLKVEDQTYLVVKLTGKVPAKIVKELKSKFNEAVLVATQVVTVSPEL